MNNPEKTGMIIRQRRKELGLSQLQLAEKLNVQNTTISRWETGEGYPDISLLIELTKILNVKIGELLDSPDHENYLNHSIQTFYKFKNPFIQILINFVKILFILIPISLHIFLFVLANQSMYLTLGTLSWLPFSIKTIALLFLAIFIIFDKFLYKTLVSTVNQFIVRLDNGQLAPTFSLLFVIDIILVVLSIIIIL